MFICAIKYYYMINIFVHPKRFKKGYCTERDVVSNENASVSLER